MARKMYLKGLALAARIAALGDDELPGPALDLDYTLALGTHEGCKSLESRAFMLGLTSIILESRAEGSAV